MAVAMLDHNRAAGGQDKHDRGGDIEKVKTIAARAAHIDHRTGQLVGFDRWIDSPFHEEMNKGHDLLRAFALAVQPSKKLRFQVVVGFGG